MNKKILSVFMMAAFIVMTFALTGCSSVGKAAVEKKPQMGELKYEIIDTGSSDFKMLPEEITQWYETNFKTEGLHSIKKDEKLYLLISAGEKRSAGYSLGDLVLNGKEKEIEVKVKLQSPSKDEFSASVITYPHLLIQLPEDNRQLVFGGIEGNVKPPETENRTDSGKYIGQIDSNSIEIAISGVPDKIAPRAFQLADKVKENFEDYGLKTGDEVIFNYIANENRPIIIDIKKLK